MQDDLTFNDLNWCGDHIIKMGVKFKEVKLTGAGRIEHTIRSSTTT